MRKHGILPYLLTALMLALLAGLLFAPALHSRAQDFGVSLTPNRESINVRVAPALGHEVIGALHMGQTVSATGRSGNGRWYRIDFFGEEGWVERTVVNVSGDVSVLPLGDPPIAPFDLGDGPRAGPGNYFGNATIRLPESGIRFRAGPGDGYFVFGNVPRYEVLSVTGRNINGTWLQVNFRGTLGWIAHLGPRFIEWQAGSVEAVPLWGVVADGPPVNQPITGPSATRDALMTAMLLHIDFSTPRLDMIAGIWNTIAMTGRQSCAFDLGHPQPYIPREGDLMEFPEIAPVIAALNQGLEETGRAIDLWQDWCRLRVQDYPGAAALVGPAQESVSNARAGFAQAQAQIEALGLLPTPTPLPPDITPAAPIATVTPESLADLPDLMAFGLEGNRVIFAPQFTHPEAGCAWQGLGGQILGLNGQPLIGLTVRVQGVTDPSLVLETVSGSTPAYGSSGWEIKVTDGVNSHVYQVTLYQGSRRVSDPKLVAFPNDCGRNLGIMNFQQLTPLQ
ncbi:MAG: SH3 domain-containing protein [Anaerolineae bacterium]|nr:SH3 domain-containing protein [Anaerolineae bacterium]